MDPATAFAWALLALAAAAALGLVILIAGLTRVFARAPRLAEALAQDAPTGSDAGGDLAPTSLTVVVPAYNEAANIAACLSSILRSDNPCADWRVLLVDDRSGDATVAIAKEAARDSGATEPRFTELDAGPRPRGERWVGKNWACSRAMEQVNSEWVLFVDADVRLQPATLRRALAQARADGADLLSLAPRLSCGCLAEWMVQPIMASLLGLGFPIEAANDPASDVAFAAGPFMLFRRSAYDAIGGHRALAAVVVEDLALARRIKQSGHRLRYLLGLDALELRMYSDFASLWEGWSKNWLLGLDGDVAKALAASAVVLLMFSGPWLLAPAAAFAFMGFAAAGSAPLGIAALGIAPLGIAPLAQTTWGLGTGGLIRLGFAPLGLAPLGPAPLGLPIQALLLLSALVLALAGIALQLLLRLWTRRQFQMPLTLWWLMGTGGLVVGAIGPVSVWRTLTGRSWTWKGRPLA